MAFYKKNFAGKNIIGNFEKSKNEIENGSQSLFA